jgi:hypothetical protein
MLDQTILLEYSRDFFAFTAEYFTRIRLYKPHNQMDNRGFSDSGGTHQAVQSAFDKCYIKIFKHCFTVKLFCQMP